MNAPVILTRRAPVGATTWDPETLTCEVVLSAGSAVERRDARGVFDEILSLSHAWPERVPLLDSHARESVDRVLGSVDALRVVGGELLGRATLSRHNPRAQRIAAELSDGQTFGVSIGYAVMKWNERTNPVTGRRERVAVAWDLLEASLVAVPADRRSGIRGYQMTVTTEPAAEPTPAAPAPEDRAAANSEIRSIGRVASLDQTWVDEQIDAGATVESARAAAFAAMRTRSAAAAQVRTTTSTPDASDPQVRAAVIGEALYARINPAHVPSDQARAYVGLTIPEIARNCVRSAGTATTGLSAAGVIERALHTTSDFPVILGDTVGRTLRESYSAAPSGIRRLGRQTTARDFRAKHRVQLSAAPTLEKVNEAGEFKSGTLAEAKESYKIDTFGRIIGITRQALVNDDLGAFTDLSRRLGGAAAAFEADFLAKLVTANGAMEDGKALFHADHGNLAASGNYIMEAALTDARIAMRRQTGLVGELISVTPKYLLVSPENETLAEKTVSSIQATNAADVNAFANLSVIVEPRFTGQAWYLVADPAEVDGLEYAYLEGEPGPQTTTQAGFDVDGVRIRVRLDFGGAFVDWRGWHRNAGGA